MSVPNIYEDSLIASHILLATGSFFKSLLTIPLVARIGDKWVWHELNVALEDWTDFPWPIVTMGAWLVE
jgi:hypothetical protein